MTNAPLLAVEDLVIELPGPSGPLRPVDGVSFALGAAETLGILGESGSGKSMTSLAVMGLLGQLEGRIARGRVLFDGRDLAALSPAALADVRGRRIAMVFQDPLSALNPVLTVGEQIAETFRRHRGLGRREALEAAASLMERVQIPMARRRIHDYPHQFSGGMRQRVMIAMAIALDPEILIADEPTTALDVTVQRQILRLLERLTRERRMALILITHDLGVIARMAGRVLVMYAGRIVEQGATRAVLQAPCHPYTRGLLASVPRPADKGGRLAPIAGNPPSLGALPSGCAFHPRCPRAEARCRDQIPHLRRLTPGRRSACHFAQELLGEAEAV